MIEMRKTRRTFIADKAISETIDEAGIKNPTAKDVINHMLGDDFGRGGNYAIYSYDEPTERRFIQRLNMLWVWPIIILSIPFQFLFCGDIGVNRNSKVGRVVDWLVKFD